MRAYRKVSWVAATALTLFAACGDDDGGNTDTPDAMVPPGTPDAAPPVDNVVIVSADITASTTWVATKTYILPGFKPTFVKNGATLTIEAGTVIKGDQASLLAVARGAKIEAAGTKEKPIVFTSNQADDKKARGFWGGLLILGKAKINNLANEAVPKTETVFEAFSSSVTDGFFGGTEDADNSGTLKYVRIEFAGYNFVADREFNNLTLCGVGSGTTIDFVQVHGGADDGIEFFGGTVNVKHIVSTQNQDDGFDTDNGWSGKAQFVIVQDVVPQAAAEASNGYESDNHGSAPSYTALPRTLPTVYNVTLIGKGKDGGGTAGHYAARLRRGTGGKYYNHIFVNFQRPVQILDAPTTQQITDGNLFIKNSIFFTATLDQTAWLAADTDTTVVEGPILFGEGAASWSNVYQDPALMDATNLKTPKFAPIGTAVVGATPEAGGGFFDTTATFIGAIGTEDWTTGWTAYPQPAGFGQ